MMKYFICYVVPSIPTIIHEECSTVNNSVTVAWQALNPMSNDGYVLELDDGSGGEFRVRLRKNFHNFYLFCSIFSVLSFPCTFR